MVNVRQVSVVVAILICHITPIQAFGQTPVSTIEPVIGVVTEDGTAIVDSQSKIISTAHRGQKILVKGVEGSTEWLSTKVMIDGKSVTGWISPTHVKVPSATEKCMAMLMTGLIHLLVLCSIVMMFGFMLRVVNETSDSTERLLRATGIATGLLAYAGARALGLSIPNLLASSLSTVRPISTGIWGVVAPATAGTVVAWFCIHAMRRDADVGKRTMNLFCAFVFTMFADVYTTVAGKISASDAQLALPNITFIIGVAFYTILTYRRPESARKASSRF
jgi:hypothetical protein